MIGRTVSQFEIIAKLGEGGMGAVYLAEDRSLKRQVALKVLPARIGSDPDRLRRLQREAETLASLNHPNIVTIHSAAEEDGVRFLVMERVVGRTLDDLIPEGGLDAGRFFELATPIANAMAAAHGRGIIHRDLKPANVMVADDGVVKVLDLGLAKLHETGETDQEAPTESLGLTVAGGVIGTIGYMSPEQAQGRIVGPQSDIFSLGTTFYEMLSGTNPFRRESTASSLAAILHHQPPPLHTVHRGIPRELERILTKCLAKNPDERYPSAEPLLHDLEAAAVRHRRRHTGLRGLLRRPAVAVACGVVLLAVAALSGWLWHRTSERRWAREVALPEIERLVENSWRDYTEAYDLAVRAE